MRLADVGENAIRKQLSYFSTITKTERDVGIDLICELVVDNKPWARYYVQAKGTEHFDDQWGSSIKKSTVTYWLKQEDPVYLIVYDDKADKSYWMSIEDHRYELFDRIMKADSQSNSIYVRMDKSQILEDGKEKNQLFRSKILSDKYSIQQFYGHPPMPGTGYIRPIPPPPRNAHELIMTKETIRQSLYSVIIHYLGKNDIQTAYLCCEFLTKFDKGHYNHFEWFGLLNIDLGKPAEAKSAFEEAIHIFEEDKKWPLEDKELQIKRIKKEMEASKIG
jgi:tetratricopeptide (TPR) repeat protein